MSRLPANNHLYLRGSYTISSWRRSGFAILAVGLSMCAVPSAAGPATSNGVVLGIDAWIRLGFEPLRGARIGLITNQTGRDRSGRLTAQVLADTQELELAALFSPEHGFMAKLQGPVADSHWDTIPIHSLYGERRAPTKAMLAGLDALVVDIQDIGTRFYTYASTMRLAMEAAASAGLHFVVLDRPNPITGNHVEGPVSDESVQSFVTYAPLPLRHGMTMGELARYFNEEQAIGVELTIIKMEGWQRSLWYDETDLLWVNTSPNIRNVTQALLYPAIGPLETTNVSVGRGTDEPFEWFGAPWINARALARQLNGAELPGIRFVARHRTPSSGVHVEVDCGGVDLVLTDRDTFDAGIVAVTLAVTLARLYPERWNQERFPHLWGKTSILDQLESGQNAATIASSWKPDLAAFVELRTRYLIYK